MLGPIEVLSNGTPIATGYAKQRAVLAMLLFEPGRIVPIDQMIDRIWGVGAPRSARSVLYGHVTRLRRALAETGAWAGRSPLRRRAGGYLLDAAPAAVDLHRFRTLLRKARAATDDGVAVTSLSAALELWRGPALAGTDGPWIDRIRVALDRELLAARLDLYDLWLRQGRHEELLGDLTGLAADYPLHEAVAHRLMVALYRSGHTEAALDCYTRLRRELADELGTDPGVELAGLQQAILRRDPALLANVAA